VQTLAFAGFCFLALFIQKDRFVTLASACLIVVVLYGVFDRHRWRFFVLVGWSAFLAILLIASVLLPGIGASVETFATRGEADETTASLTGRMPLWEELIQHLEDRLVEGHGFGAFWNPETVPEVQSAVRWPAVVAHQGFLDEALATGVIGLCLFLVFWLGGLLRCLRRAAVTGTAVDRLIPIWLLLFLLLNVTQSVLQTYFQAPFFISLTAILAMLARGHGRAELPADGARARPRASVEFATAASRQPRAGTRPAPAPRHWGERRRHPSRQH
jgi:O-antigen ligase